MAKQQEQDISEQLPPNAPAPVTKCEYEATVAELTTLREELDTVKTERDRYAQAVNKLINIAAQRYAQDLAAEVLTPDK